VRPRRGLEGAATSSRCLGHRSGQAQPGRIHTAAPSWLGDHRRRRPPGSSWTAPSRRSVLWRQRMSRWLLRRPSRCPRPSLPCPAVSRPSMSTATVSTRPPSCLPGRVRSSTLLWSPGRQLAAGTGSRGRSSRRSYLAGWGCRRGPAGCAWVAAAVTLDRLPTRTGFRHAGCPSGGTAGERGCACVPAQAAWLHALVVWVGLDGVTLDARLGLEAATTLRGHREALGSEPSGPGGPSDWTAGQARGPSAAQTCSERRRLDADDALTCSFRGGGEGI
jgi:hypothetical protein